MNTYCGTGLANPQNPRGLTLAWDHNVYAARIDIFRAGRLRCTELRDLFVRVSECAGDRRFKDKTLNPDFCHGAVFRTLAQSTTQ